MRRMALPKFIFNDETKKNSHGFFLLNGGGKFERFQEYSPMLDNHDLNRLIGRWDNLHVEGALLVADPVFDDGITLGAERKGQVERGFLRGASPASSSCGPSTARIRQAVRTSMSPSGSCSRVP